MRTQIADQEVAREISRGMVALVKRYVGRGPEHSRTYIHDDLVVVVLRETMTKAERTLVEEEHEDAVKQVRRLFQGTFRDEAIGLIQATTGRKVLAFLSDHAVEPDYAVEVFVLEASEDGGGDATDGKGEGAPAPPTETAADDDGETTELVENPAPPGEQAPTG